jgi:hypothetical protein
MRIPVPASTLHLTFANRLAWISMEESRPNT